MSDMIAAMACCSQGRGKSPACCTYFPASAGPGMHSASVMRKATVQAWHRWKKLVINATRPSSAARPSAKMPT